MAVSKYTAKDGKVKWYFSVRYTDWTGERKRKKQEGFKTQKEAKEAEAKGLMNLKGHRSTGGMRASIYNAMPAEGVRALVSFMKEFENAE